jgi:Ca2+-binding EF-hand superfamily protein
MLEESHTLRSFIVESLASPVRMLVVDDDLPYDATPYEYATLTFLLITMLVAVTILFELYKDYSIDEASKYMKQVVLTMYSELTVLGFLALFIFTFSYVVSFETLSTELFNAPKYINAFMDAITFLLALVMVIRILQVSIFLLDVCDSAYAMFCEFEDDSHQHEHMNELLENINDLEDTSMMTNFLEFVWSFFSAHVKYSERFSHEMCLLYYSLRREHIEKRNALPPFEVHDKHKQLPHDFVFANYLELCLSRFLADVASVKWTVWLSIWVYMVVCVGIIFACQGRYDILAVLWVLFYCLQIYAIYYLDKKCDYIFENLVNPLHLHPREEEELEKLTNWKRMQQTISQRSARSNKSPTGGRSPAVSPLKLRPPKSLTVSADDIDTLPPIPTPLSPVPPLGMEVPPASSAAKPSTTVKKRRKSIEDTGRSRTLPAPSMGSAQFHSTLHTKRSLYFIADENKELIESLKKHSSVVVRLKQNHSIKPGIYDIDVTKLKAGFLSSLFMGNAPPNRHEMLFICDKLGPLLNAYVLSSHLIFQAIYIAITYAVLVPYICMSFQWYWGLLYTVYATLPLMLELFGFLFRAIVRMSIVASVGLLRDSDYEREVIRAQKMNKVLRMMVLLTKLQAAETRAMSGKGSPRSQSYDPQDMSNLSELKKEEIHEISRVFDLYDMDKRGEVGPRQLKRILETLGFTDEGFSDDETFAIMDLDHDGRVSKHELIEWRLRTYYGETERSSVESTEQLAKRLFRNIDTDNSGDVTLVEFHEALQVFNEPPFNANLSDAEIISILKDFDEDGDGTISFEEFLKVVEAGAAELVH